MRRRTETAGKDKSANELKGREVMTEPPAKARRGGPKSAYGHMEDDELRVYARSIASVKMELRKKEAPLYHELKRRQLLDETYGKSMGRIERRIIETAERLEKEEKLESKIKGLDEVDLKIFRLITQKNHMTGRETAELLGISPVTLSVHKRRIAAYLNDERPPRTYTRYAGITDDELREMIKESGAETIHQVYLLNGPLACEIYYREKHFGADYSDALKRKISAEEKRLKSAVDGLLESMKPEDILEHLFDDEKKLVENILSENPKSPEEMGLYWGRLAYFAKNLPLIIECRDTRGKTRELRKTIRKVLERGDAGKIMNLLGAEEREIACSAMEGNPPNLEEIGKRIKKCRERVRQMTDEVREKLELACEGKEKRRKTHITKRLKKLRKLSHEFSKREDADAVIRKHFDAIETGILLFRGLCSAPFSLKEMADASNIPPSSIKEKEKKLIEKLRMLERDGGIADKTDFHQNPKSKYGSTPEEELITMARKTAMARGELSKTDHTLYTELNNRNLLYRAFGPPLKRGRPRKK